MQRTRKKTTKNRLVRFPVEQMIEDNDWIFNTYVNHYSVYEYPQFLKLLTRELFFYITRILDIKVGFPKIVTATNRNVVGRWECKVYNHLWMVPFINREYSWRLWYKRIEQYQSKLYIVSKFDYRFRLLFSIVLHEIIHGYMMDRSLSDLSMHGPRYRFYMWKFNRIMKSNGLPVAYTGGTTIDGVQIKYR